MGTMACKWIGFMLVEIYSNGKSADLFRVSDLIDLILFFECRETPLQIIHIIGNLMRIWSVYSVYRYLSQTGASVVLFIFSCLVPSSIIFLVLQKPWKGRPLSNTQVIMQHYDFFCYFSWLFEHEGSLM